ADEWRENAEEHEGSWWEDWRGWLEQRSGEQTDPPRLGSEKYPPIEDAPGTYVKEMHEDEEEREGTQAGGQDGQQGAAKRTITGIRIEGYDELNVGEVVERLDDLSAEELQRVRAYEQRNKNRVTLLKQIDRRINAAS
ncbi:MAG: hypothetical protein H0U65_13050, partial [Rubrobacter sp.]|nr:hypothetical protein [Rubrobacter sp.]